jgi:hypothetical protein
MGRSIDGCSAAGCGRGDPHAPTIAAIATPNANRLSRFNP